MRRPPSRGQYTKSRHHPRRFLPSVPCPMPSGASARRLPSDARAIVDTLPLTHLRGSGPTAIRFSWHLYILLRSALTKPHVWPEYGACGWLPRGAELGVPRHARPSRTRPLINETAFGSARRPHVEFYSRPAPPWETSNEAEQSHRLRKQFAASLSFGPQQVHQHARPRLGRGETGATLMLLPKTRQYYFSAATASTHSPGQAMARDSIQFPAPGPTRLSVPSPWGRPNGRTGGGRSVDRLVSQDHWPGRRPEKSSQASPSRHQGLWDGHLSRNSSVREP